MEKVQITRRPVPPSDLPLEELEDHKKNQKDPAESKPAVDTIAEQSKSDAGREDDKESSETVQPESSDDRDKAKDAKSIPSELEKSPVKPGKKPDEKPGKKTPKSVINEDGKPHKKSTTALSRIGIGQERDFLVENLSVLMGSGMTIISALDAIRGEMKTKVMKTTIDTLRREVDEGMPIWKSMDNTGLFTMHAIALLKIGEESGRLPANLKVISEQSQKDRMLKSKLFSALLYPVAVLILALVMGILIAWFLLPKLSGIFDSLNMKLPFMTRVLMSLGKFLGSDGYWAIPLLFGFIGIIMYVLFINKKTLHIGQSIMFSLPIVKRLIQETELARFGYILNNLLGAGIPLVDALDSLSIASTYIRYQKYYAFMRDNIELGNTFQKCFEEYPIMKPSKLIPYPIQMMIVTSERSGKLEDTLGVIARMYEEKTELTTKNLSTMLEPLMLVVIFVAVVFLALGVLMPIYGMLGGINVSG